MATVGPSEDVDVDVIRHKFGVDNLQFSSKCFKFKIQDVVREIFTVCNASESVVFATHGQSADLRKCSSGWHRRSSLESQKAA